MRISILLLLHTENNRATNFIANEIYIERERESNQNHRKYETWEYVLIHGYECANLCINPNKYMLAVFVCMVKIYWKPISYDAIHTTLYYAKKIAFIWFNT